jgi:hypothetical protein
VAVPHRLGLKLRPEILRDGSHEQPSGFGLFAALIVPMGNLDEAGSLAAQPGSLSATEIVTG